MMNPTRLTSKDLINRRSAGFSLPHLDSSRAKARTPIADQNSADRAPATSSTPLRIAIVAACPFPTLQGSQVLIRQHAQAMAARGHIVHVVAYHLGLAEQVDGVQVHRIPAMPFYTRMRAGPSTGKPLLDALLAIKLLAVARRERIDLFHAHNIEGVLAAWPVARWLRKPIVFHTHTLMEGELPTYFGTPIARRMARAIGRWLDATLPRLADRTIVLSPEARSAFARLGTPWDRLVYIPPGIEDRPVELAPLTVRVPCEASPWDADGHREACPEPCPERGRRGSRRDAAAEQTGNAYGIEIGDHAETTRARYNLGHGPLAIYTGNLDPYQGLDDLLHAFSEVRRSVPDAQLIIASHTVPDASLNGKLHRMCLSGDGVRTIRVRAFDEAAALLAVSDVAVCPRPACLGYPIKLLNYMAAAKGIVCAAGSARDITHLHNGTIYPDGDVTALAAGLVRLLTDRALAQRLGRNAHQTVQRLRWSTLAESFDALYHDLILQNGRSGADVYSPTEYAIRHT